MTSAPSFPLFCDKMLLFIQHHGEQCLPCYWYASEASKYLELGRNLESEQDNSQKALNEELIKELGALRDKVQALESTTCELKAKLANSMAMGENHAEHISMPSNGANLLSLAPSTPPNNAVPNVQELGLRLQQIHLTEMDEDSSQIKGDTNEDVVPVKQEPSPFMLLASLPPSLPPRLPSLEHWQVEEHMERSTPPSMLLPSPFICPNPPGPSQQNSPGTKSTRLSAPYNKRHRPSKRNPKTDQPDPLSTWKAIMLEMPGVNETKKIKAFLENYTDPRHQQLQAELAAFRPEHLSVAQLAYISPDKHRLLKEFVKWWNFPQYKPQGIRRHVDQFEQDDLDAYQAMRDIFTQNCVKINFLVIIQALIPSDWSTITYEDDQRVNTKYPKHCSVSPHYMREHLQHSCFFSRRFADVTFQYLCRQYGIVEQGP
jgi:hypothetical protein